MVFLGLVGLVFVIAAPLIAGLFTSDPDVRPYAVGCLRIVSLGFVFYACGMVLTQAFNGAGDTWTPTIINLFIFWFWEIPLAWWLSTGTDLGARGVFFALTIAYSSLAIVSAVLFKRGAWKRSRV
jgi:Na+-driven multidrug efflux pump